MAAPAPRPRSPSGLLSQWAEWLWRDEASSGATTKVLRSALQVAVALARELAAGDLSLRAASLVYTTILSVVPLLALSFSVLKGLGVHRRLEPLLENFLAPLGPRAGELTARVISFVDNVEGSVLAGLSLALLLLTTLSLAQKIESSFNFVWRISRPRSLIRRISDYLSLVLAGPIVMSVALGLMAALTESSLLGRLRATEPFRNALALLGEATPYVLVIASFAFLYAYLPNTRVRFRPALVGGIFGGVAWVGSGYLFAAFVGISGRNEAIYSGFAAVIAAMLWLYVSWLVLLLGAEIAFFVQNPFWLRQASTGAAAAEKSHERVTLAAMLEIAQRFARGEPALKPAKLAERLRVPRYALEPALDRLDEAGLIERTRRGDVLPTRDLRRIDLAEIVRVARRSGDHWVGESERARIEALTARVDAAIERELGTETLAAWLAEPGEEPESEATRPRA